MSFFLHNIPSRSESKMCGLGQTFFYKISMQVIMTPSVSVLYRSCLLGFYTLKSSPPPPQHTANRSLLSSSLYLLNALQHNSTPSSAWYSAFFPYIKMTRTFIIQENGVDHKLHLFNMYELYEVRTNSLIQCNLSVIRFSQFFVLISFHYFCPHLVKGFSEDTSLH